MENELKVRALAAPWFSGVEFLARDGDAVGMPIMMDVPINKGISCNPTFSLSMGAAQALMDDLWNVGLRPTEGTGSAGSLAATQRHLEDMRTLVFKK
jgi:hypothetical protein